MALLTGCYLLFSKANAFATDITPPVRLRRWTGVFLVSKPIDAKDFFGPASFHDNDYTFYYNNIKENVAKRIATYKANH